MKQTRLYGFIAQTDLILYGFIALCIVTGLILFLQENQENIEENSLLVKKKKGNKYE